VAILGEIHPATHGEKWELPGLVNVYKKRWKDPPCLKGKSTISMAMFNSYLVGGFNPSEKYEFVRLDHHPSYWGSHKIHVPNHQPVMLNYQRVNNQTWRKDVKSLV
jgi:hypothetical protein